jgi:tetratricopeptide (TPR) repeat protein
LFILVLIGVGSLLSCASGRGITSAEEYYSLGMAYFELGKYEEAEKWLNRARFVDKTKNASEYNLGRIAFETGRYRDAVRHFDRILASDPDNVLALKAAAYTRIKTAEYDQAETLYNRVLALVPESADDGYNYALVLYVLKKPEKAEEVLLRYQYRLDENKEALLLLARSQKAQDKVEAADNYSRWLQNNQDAQVRYEYAQVLEKGEFYARAVEEYRTVIAEVPVDSGTSETADITDTPKLTKGRVRFLLARLLLIADSESEEGISELRTAVTEGFSDTETLETLLNEPKISDSRKNEIRSILDEIAAAAEAAEKEEPVETDPADSPVETPADSPVKTAPTDSPIETPAYPAYPEIPGSAGGGR